LTLCLCRCRVAVDYCHNGQYDESVWKFYESWYSEFDSCPVGGVFQFQSMMIGRDLGEADSFRFLLSHLICFILVSECWFLYTLRMYVGSSVANALVVVFASNCSPPPRRANIRQYLQAVLRQNIAFFDRLGAGEVTNRISHDVDLIQDGISDKVSSVVR